jgi:hypothetical protein
MAEGVSGLGVVAVIGFAIVFVFQGLKPTRACKVESGASGQHVDQPGRLSA